MDFFKYWEKYGKELRCRNIMDKCGPIYLDLYRDGLKQLFYIPKLLKLDV